MASLFRIIYRLMGLPLLGLLVTLPAPALAQPAGPPPPLPALYEFGAGHCLSCRAMEPILKSLQERYRGRLQVRQVSPDQDMGLFRQYKIMLIPTQVFLDARGQEVCRHVGAWSQDELLQKLRELKFIND